MNNYEDKKRAKIQRLRDRAKKKREEAQDYAQKAEAISSMIPFGQPILVGHHSERRHRRDLKRIHDYTDKSIQSSNYADELERRAVTKENSKAIFSDNPEAIQQLKEKIEKLQQQREQMKKINADFRKCKSDVEKMTSISEKTKQILKKSLADDWRTNPKPFESYQLTNLGANIRTAKKRLEELEKKQNDETTETEFNGIKIIENVEENRCQIFFPDIPSAETRQFLKSHGFRWSRFNGCWQRHRSNVATYYANQVINMNHSDERGERTGEEK